MVGVKARNPKRNPEPWTDLRLDPAARGLVKLAAKGAAMAGKMGGSPNPTYPKSAEGAEGPSASGPMSREMLMQVQHCADMPRLFPPGAIPQPPPPAPLDQARPLHMEYMTEAEYMVQSM